MRRTNSAERHEMKIIVFGKVHTIIEQDATRPAWQKGAYMGHEGYVLKRVDELSSLTPKETLTEAN